MGIKVTIRGTEYDLETVNPTELEEVLDTLTEEEEEDVQKQIMDALGIDNEDDMIKLVELIKRIVAVGTLGVQYSHCLRNLLGR